MTALLNTDRLRELGDAIAGLPARDANRVSRYLAAAYGIEPAKAAEPLVIPDNVTAADEPTEFDVILTDLGPQRVAAVRAVRTLTGQSVREVVDSVPLLLKTGVSFEAADELQRDFQACGAVVDVIPAAD